MNNVSFKANLVVNDNLYKNLPEGTPEGYTDNLVQGFKKFLEHDVVKAVTEDDTIELYRDKYNHGFAVGIEFKNDKCPEPLKTGIYTNKKIPTVHAGYVIRETMLYLIIKSGIETQYFEKFNDTFVRAVKKLLNDKKTKE